MKIPDKIKIGGRWITIKKVTDKELQSDLGSFSNWYQRIQINQADTCENLQAETLLHEILEAIIVTYTIKIKHQDLSIISQAIFQVIRDNKLDFISKGEKL